MIRASYRHAIRWLRYNDDNEWLKPSEWAAQSPSVSACLVADLFGVEVEKVERDLRREIEGKEP